MSCVWMSGLHVCLLSACLVSTEARRGHQVPWSWSGNTVTSHCRLLGREPRSFWGAAKANTPAVSPRYGLHYVHECRVREHDDDQKTTFGVVISFSMWVPSGSMSSACTWTPCWSTFYFWHKVTLTILSILALNWILFSQPINSWDYRLCHQAQLVHPRSVCRFEMWFGVVHASLTQAFYWVIFSPTKAGLELSYVARLALNPGHVR